jgi:hypothetical protein
MYVFWNFHPKPVKELTPSFFCGTVFNDVLQTKEPIDWLTEIRSLIKDYWAPGIVFILMTVLTIRKLYYRPKHLTMAR